MTPQDFTTLMDIPDVRNGKVRIELDSQGFIVRRGVKTELVSFQWMASHRGLSHFKMAIRRVARIEVEELA